ncbi:putative membrane protein [Primorskyibacter sedentarius]|uniref:Putative membrane protein n=1 Tax=Primorskyibacter sedentarius TaxID=745311 RepID=A0A4R3J7L2_9RHOB|nr:DMT family transporter [Primorskyibacter sedentarius]TCS61412.1 putative membrane protein [Primorskyibacter sedentarius]
MSYAISSVPNPTSSVFYPRDTVFGYFAMGITLCIWAGFALSARATESSHLEVADVAFIRACVPALVLCPFLWLRREKLRALPLRYAATIAIGGGAPFFALAAIGGALTSATHVGALIAGTVPVSVALLIWAGTGRRPTFRAACALLTIACGALLLLLSSDTHDSHMAWGVVSLLMASLAWGAYTIGLRNSGLDPLTAGALVSVPSAAILLPLIATGTVPTALVTSPVNELIAFIFVQGVGVGLVASLTYTTAIRLLGADKCAAIGAAAPALTAVLAWPVLGEALSIPILVAVCVICAGIWRANKS